MVLYDYKDSKLAVMLSYDIQTIINHIQNTYKNIQGV